MTDISLIASSRADGILQLTFNRPARRNALNGEMYLELARLVAAATAETEVRVILLQGGNGYFTAGNDLEDFVPVPKELLAMRFFRAVAECCKPVVAAVESCAIGIGTTILGHCDFAYAGASTRFAAPFAKLGVCAEGASSLWLAQIAGDKRAAEILLLGEPFSAAAALEAGLITAVVEDGKATERAMEVARRLAALSPEVVQANKKLLKHGRLAVIRETLDREEQEFLRLLAEAPAQTAIQAFLAPRKP